MQFDKPLRIDPRDRNLDRWRARKASLAARGVRSGEAVDECVRALEYHKFARRLQGAIRSGLIDEEFAAAISKVAARSAMGESAGMGAFAPLRDEPSQTSVPSSGIAGVQTGGSGGGLAVHAAEAVSP